MAPSDSRSVSTRLLGLEYGEFEVTVRRALDELGERPYRTGQIAEWVYRRRASRFSEMSDLPKGLRQRLDARFALNSLEQSGVRRSSDGTRKYLWSRRGDGGAKWPRVSVESVWIPDGERVTYCVSTQAGCPVNCSFCATGHGGFQGQLRADEIVEQVLQMWRWSDSLPTNVVFMGMGEPLLNFEEMSRAVEILTHPRQVGLGHRRLTVSTVGIPERIRQFSRRFPQVKLALSLHAARDALRDELIPLNRKYPLDEVIEAVREHTRVTGKLVTIEYVILPGVNDTRDDARGVARVLEGIPSRINLIGFNPFSGASFRKPSVRELMTFRHWLEEGFPGAVTIRRSRGEDIEGACGQLSLAHTSSAQGPS